MRDKYWVIQEHKDPKLVWTPKHQMRIGQFGYVVYQEISINVSFSLGIWGKDTSGENEIETEYDNENSLVTLEFEDGEQLTFHLKSLGQLRDINLKKLEI